MPVGYLGFSFGGRLATSPSLHLPFAFPLSLPFLFPSTLVVTCEDSGVPPAGKAAILSPTCIFAHLVANGFPKTVLNLLQPQNDYIT